MGTDSYIISLYHPTKPTDTIAECEQSPKPNIRNGRVAFWTSHYGKGNTHSDSDSDSDILHIVLLLGTCIFVQCCFAFFVFDSSVIASVAAAAAAVFRYFYVSDPNDCAWVCHNMGLALFFLILLCVAAVSFHIGFGIHVYIIFFILLLFITFESRFAIFRLCLASRSKSSRGLRAGIHIA